MSDELRTYTKADLVDFYTDVLAAIDKPEEHEWFTPYGLCILLPEWAHAHGIRPEVSERLYWVQTQLFDTHGLNRQYPFNNGDFMDYREEGQDERRYTNPARLDWIKRGAANDL